MLSTESAIFRLRRDLTLGTIVRLALLAAAVGSFLVLPRLLPQVHGTVPLLGVVAIWIALGYSSAKNSRIAADAPNLIAAGRFEEAEQQLNDAIRSFSAFRGPKLQTLAQLAELRHAQERYRECATLCQEVLSHRGGDAPGLATQLRFLLIDSLLEVKDLQGAHASLSVVAARPLALSEVLRLLFLQMSYESKVGAWDRMTHDLMEKVRLAELMPTSPAATVQALLALAAKRTHREDVRDWLMNRAVLLLPAEKLIDAEPLLAELWPTPTPVVA